MKLSTEILNYKIMREIRSKDFKDLPCNCTNPSRIEGNCIYGEKCRVSMVVYKAKCVKTGKIYVGNTQQKLKERMNQHYGEVCKLVNNGQSSDSFARHFGKILEEDEEVQEAK